MRDFGGIDATQVLSWPPAARIRRDLTDFSSPCEPGAAAGSKTKMGARYHGRPRGDSEALGRRPALKGARKVRRPRVCVRAERGESPDQRRRLPSPGSTGPRLIPVRPGAGLESSWRDFRGTDTSVAGDLKRHGDYVKPRRRHFVSNAHQLRPPLRGTFYRDGSALTRGNPLHHEMLVETIGSLGTAPAH